MNAGEELFESIDFAATPPVDRADRVTTVATQAA
jgi:hypothetical protein